MLRLYLWQQLRICRSNLQLSFGIFGAERLIDSRVRTGVVMTLKQLGSRSLTTILSALLCNVPQYLIAQTNVTSAPQSTQLASDEIPQHQNAQSNVQQSVAIQDQSQSAPPDPAQAPLAPAPSARPADTNAVPPDAPSEVQRSQQPPTTTAAEAQPAQPQRPANPLGTATAQKGTTRGGVASRPAGEAIAPAKQRQVHSLLIKLGLVAAGAAAVGTVVGLTRGTSSIPPGAR